MGLTYNSHTDSYSADSGTNLNHPNPLGENVFQAATDFEVAGDVLSTAKSPQGSPVVGRGVQDSDTIHCHGQRMTIGQAIQLGFVTKDIAGNFTATPEGIAGAKDSGAPKGKIELASGGTAEEAEAGGFLGTPEAEDALAAITQNVAPETQVAALHSFLRNGGEVDQNTINRMASQAGVEPSYMAETIEAAHEGMTTAIMEKLRPLGVYDPNVFAHYLHGDNQTHQRMIESARDLMMNNSTKGFEALAEDFAMMADKVDPAGVAEALTDSGIKFSRMSAGGYLLDLTEQGHGQMTFKQAVQLKLIKLR